MPSTAVIELDRSDPWEPPDPPGWSGRVRARSVAVAAVLVAVFGLVAGAEPAPSLAPVMVLPGRGVTDLRLDGDALVVIRRLDPEQTIVESYRISDGRLRWTSRVEPYSQLVEVGGGRVVLTVMRPQQGSTSTLVALDAASGSQVWRRAEHAPALFGAAGGFGVILAEPSVPVPEPGLDPRRDGHEVLGIDRATGDIRWSLRAPAGTFRWYVSVDGDATRGRVQIADVDPGGVLRLHDAGSGSVVHTVTLDQPGRFDGFDIAGGRLLGYRFGPPDLGRPGMQGAGVFDLATGRMLWQRDAEPGAEPFWWWWCGQTLCSGTDRATTGVDPDTGRGLWHLDGWTNLESLRDRRFLVTRAAPGGHPLPDALVIDAATGRTLRRLDGWGLISRRPLPVILLASPTSTGSTLIALFDVDTGEMRVVGRAEEWTVAAQCTATATALACGHGRVSVWKLNDR